MVAQKPYFLATPKITAPAPLTESIPSWFQCHIGRADRHSSRAKGPIAKHARSCSIFSYFFPHSLGRNDQRCSEMWHLVLATSTFSLLRCKLACWRRQGGCCLRGSSGYALAKVLLSCSRAFQTALALSSRARLTPGSLRDNKCTSSSSSGPQRGCKQHKSEYKRDTRCSNTNQWTKTHSTILQPANPSESVRIYSLVP